MDREHMVQDVTVEIGGETHTAIYFIEDGVIHASIGDESYRLPTGSGPADETVRTHLLKVKNHSFKAEMSAKWFGGA